MNSCLNERVSKTSWQLFFLVLIMEFSKTFTQTGHRHVYLSVHSHAENVHSSHAGTPHIIIKFKTHRALNRGTFAKYVNVYTNTTVK